MMIARRKADLIKGIMKRSELTNQAKLCKKRTGEQTKDEGLRNKKARFAFQIKGNDGNHWYNTDGSMYYEETSTHDEESGKEIELKQKIKDLELKLSMAKKVFQQLIHALFMFSLSNVNYMFNMNTTARKESISQMVTRIKEGLR